MFGLNLTALLDSLDNAAKETFEEPRESATEIRSRRKAAAANKSENSLQNSSHSNIAAADVAANDPTVSNG